ncbi:MAG: hypothetical protein N4A74_10560 [Carboxylicivirga sp.]|jgi:hypothetical protein|nr:hypothetical protein [Carboxylicivirga sp.]
MYNGLIHAHSGLRYIVLALILIVIIQSLLGWTRKYKYAGSHHVLVKLNSGLLLTQFMIGLGLFTISPKVLFSAEMFKSTLLRFFTLEHPLMMLIATILVIHSAARSKAYSNYITHKKLFFYNTIALILIIASIPWPFREQLGATWF